MRVIWLLFVVGFAKRAAGLQNSDLEDSWDYSNVFSTSRNEGITFADLPGFTRSTYQRDHALITPESRVFASMPGWKNALTAHLISPATGSKFSMYLVDMKASSAAGTPPAGVERFVFVLDGAVKATLSSNKEEKLLHADDYAYFPADSANGLSSDAGAGLLIFERFYALKSGQAAPVNGSTAERPVLPVPGEVFALRKLLPSSNDYDFNIHVMDFRPGEALYVKEVHYNQHGLLLLQGQGIYRLGDSWYPVQAGDAIWMAPYVVQWYGALGSTTSRYILYKDTTEDPLEH
ncbi:hypothetical protein WJX73_006610 [Symbiochloris irregularis]|uniref:(S)-ureidoglycine aminohydrolase n=1 Tax=Symbiochloris irregularis TaxID=706552 RepID=A0AAW1NQC0_9CHLO